MTQALGTFGVYGRPGDDELAVLALADEYRERLCAAYHERHKRLVDLRNTAFPDLFAAMIESESTAAKIWEVEREIKAYHSDVEDRNAVTDEQRLILTALREKRKALQARIKELSRPWYSAQQARLMYWHSLADWKNVKSLSEREKLYAGVSWPKSMDVYERLDAEQVASGERKKPLDTAGLSADVVAALGQLEMECDLAARRLSKEYQDAGLHSAIRAEIVEASAPKTKRDGPGMRYEYGREPDPKPWEKLSLHFPDGLKVEDALAGKCKSLSLTPIYTQHKASRSHTVYEVSQQIGTDRHPRRITYRVKFHRRLEWTSQRWSLVCRDSGKREVIPIVKHSLTKPTGDGVFGYDLTWFRCKDGIQVCHFLGTNVNERLILPQWLINRRLAMVEQKSCDQEANEWLRAARNAAPKTGEKQGLSALEAWCAKSPDDNGAANRLHELLSVQRRAKHAMQRAVRCIEKIYETVAYRVCSQHAQVVHDPIDLSRLKRYDTRDLLREDKIPQKSREYLAAVSPGKLISLLENYGLASVEVLEKDAVVSRKTDLFTSYIAGMAVKTGRKQDRTTHRSQHAAVASEGT